MSNERTITPNDPADFTPQLGNYKSLQPFRFWCQKVLPLVYDDSLSYYELLCKVVDYLNKTMEDVETLHSDVTNLYIAYKKLQNYVNDYFSSLDVQEEINNKLDELVKNGTLTALLNNILISSPTSNFADVEYLCTIQNHYPYKTKSEDYSKTPTEPQGIAYINNSNVVCFYSCGEKYNGFGSEDDLVLMREFHFTDKRTNSYIVREKLISGLQHANSCSYNDEDNVIYCALRGYANPENTGVIGSTKISEIDYATLSIKKTRNIKFDDETIDRIDVIGFDKITKKLYCGVDDKIYLVNDDNTTTLMFTWSKFFSYAYNLQGLCVINNYAYIVTHNPNTIFCFTIKGSLARILNLPDYDGDGHAIRYPEDIDYDKETFDIYINCWAGTSLLSYDDVAQWRSCYVFKFNPLKNVITSHRQAESGIVNVNKTIYVSKNNNTIYQKGSSAYPYTLINEAVNAIISGTNDIIIDCVGDFDEYVNIQGVNVIFTKSVNVNSINVQSSLIRFEGGITLTGKNTKKQTCRLINSIVNINNSLDINGGANNETALYLSNSTINTDFSFDINVPNCKYAMYLVNSIFNGYCNNINPKLCHVSNSKIEKTYLPTGTKVEYNGHSCLYIEKGKYVKSGSNFYGTISASLNITINGTTRNIQTMLTRKYAESDDTVTFAMTYFGFISVHVDSELNVTSINLINLTETDLSNVSVDFIGLYLN